MWFFPICALQSLLDLPDLLSSWSDWEPAYIATVLLTVPPATGLHPSPGPAPVPDEAHQGGSGSACTVLSQRCVMERGVQERLKGLSLGL
jgi:hypothetical protein